MHWGIGAPPACVTLNTMPAIVRVAVRGAVVVLGLAVKRTSPGPLPVLPEVTVSQDAELIAVQVQLLGAATATAPLPPAAAMDSVVVESA